MEAVDVAGREPADYRAAGIAVGIVVRQQAGQDAVDIVRQVPRVARDADAAPSVLAAPT